MEGTVFNIQRYSIDDGPGIRTTVFLKGCPLRCPWCSNPESQSFAPQLSYRHTSCVKCGACAAACPNGAIELVQSPERATPGSMPVLIKSANTAEPDSHVLNIDREKCSACGTCVKACVNGALELKGSVMTVEQVWKVIRRDLVYYETSGGGVTCSGGEILAQPDFVAAIFEKCQGEGVHTCADTSGFGTREALDKILKYTDLVYFDLKHPDPKRHAELLGADAATVWSNLRYISEKGIALTLRVPLIPEYNNSAEDVDALARLARELAPAASVSILPYHRYGESKYAAVGMEYALGTLRENTEAELERAAAAFERCGFNCEVSK